MLKNMTIQNRIKHYSSPMALNGCILWNGPLTENGYALLNFKGKRLFAHRQAFELRYGPLPRGLQLDHLCRVRHCVNPKHCEIVTPRENTLRGVGPSARNARKTHCDYGHLFSVENTKIRNGWRVCRECKRAFDLKCIRLKRARMKELTDEEPK